MTSQCQDPRHETPCPLPCEACEQECDPEEWVEIDDAPEKVECFECDRTFIAYRDESVCPECIETISINRAHA